ncbi:MAG TPA: heme ABC transporter substrate-binding protein IsdE [Sporosarcina psychrophila]|uniref:High-affinity heme uptake system protein IsdE n=1 Tax=Sporosarcina psychrophila TaxID=1476 RepID=A0A921KEX9_SPOPS|nr:heme ABC transporter substrate-binding protein IsdE [Sporosarcina psychrophila]
MKMRTVRNLLYMLLAIVMLAGCSSQEGTSSNEEKIDSAGDRIVATTVALAEIMDALEIDLVGIPSSYKELPKRYKDTEKVGNPMSPDMEMLLSLKPTEILSVTTLKYDLQEMFDERDIDMTYVNLESVDAMHSEILKLGEKYDRQEQAEAIINEFEEKVAEIDKLTEGQEQPSVLILLGIPGSYLVATENSYIGDLVKRSGGKNVITGEKVEFLSSNTEYLQQAKPDIILRASHGMPEEVVKMFDDEFKSNDIWKHFEAVKNDRVYDLDELLFGTTGSLAAVEALGELQKMLYPN